MKYIDADKLKAEIERLYEGEAPSHDQQCEFEDGYFTGIATISKFIDSLQQEQPEVDLENYISNKLRELGADLINHKPYSFNRGLNVGKTKAYEDILGRLNTRKEE